MDEEERADKIRQVRMKKTTNTDSPVLAPDSPKSSVVVSLRFSRMDYAKLEMRAAKVDLSVPAYVREELFRKR